MAAYGEISMAAVSAQELAEPEWVHLASPIFEHRWLRRRMLTSAVTRQRNPGARTARAACEFEAVARRATELCLSPISTS